MNMNMDMTMDMGTCTDSATETDMDINTDMYVEMFKDKDIGDGHGHCAWTRTFRWARYCPKNQKVYWTLPFALGAFSTWCTYISARGAILCTRYYGTESFSLPSFIAWSESLNQFNDPEGTSVAMFRSPE
jgi:hypothetical protein